MPNVFTPFALTIEIFASPLLLHYTDIIGVPARRHYAITSIVILTAVIGLIATVNGAKIPLLEILFFSAVYFIGLFMENKSKNPNL